MLEDHSGTTRDTVTTRAPAGAPQPSGRGSRAVASGMPRFEYCLVEVQGRRSRVERELNKLGRDGWEVVSTLESSSVSADPVLVLMRMSDR